MLRDDFKSFEVLQQAKLCQTIVDLNFQSNLGINHFSVVVLTEDCRVSVASTLPQYYQACVDRQLVYYDPIYSPQVHEKLSMYLWDDEINSGRLDEVRWLRTYYRLYNSISLVRRSPGCCILYSISTSKPLSILRSLLLNQTDKIIKTGDEIFQQLIGEFNQRSTIEIAEISC